jgi:hypothetical protein
MVTFEQVLGERIGSMAAGFAEKIHEINRKYEKPRITMSRGVKLALLFLRIYLILLVVLLAYKFWTLLK